MLHHKSYLVTLTTTRKKLVHPSDGRLCIFFAATKDIEEGDELRSGQQSITRSIRRSFNESLIQSISQSIGQPMNQSVNDNRYDDGDRDSTEAFVQPWNCCRD